MDNLFYPNACVVCRAYGRDVDFKRCSNCKMIGYCSREHQREHWPLHKDICRVLGNRIKQYGSIFPPKGEEEIIDILPWFLRKQKLMSIVQSQLGREFLDGEAEMLLYARSCEVCHETNPKKLVDCSDCPLSSFCKKHTNAEHQEKCKLAILLSKSNGEFYDSLHKLSMLNIGTKIPEDMEGVANCYREHYSKKKNTSGVPTEIWFLRNMEYLWRPYTFLYGIKKLSMSRFPWNIHVVGAKMEEISTVAGWEVLLHHAKLSKDVVITFIGPELEDCVHFAQLGKNRKILVNTVGKFYHDYVNSDTYTKPNVIVVFNGALQVSRHDWAPTIKEIKKLKCPFLITAMTEIDIEKDQYKINRVLDKDINPAYFGRNPYHGLAPICNTITQEITQSGLYLMIYEKL